MKQFLIAFAFGALAFGQSPFTYDVSRLPANVIGGGVGAKLTVPSPGFSSAQGFGFYATQVTPGLYEYNLVTMQNGSSSVSAGAEGYLGTFFNKISCLGALAAGASFTPAAPTAKGAIGNIFNLGGDCFVGLKKTASGNRFIVGAGGSRDLSNQAQMNSFNIRAMFGYTF